VWSGRSNRTEQHTREWLAGVLPWFRPDGHLLMRESGNTMANTELKQRWYFQQTKADRERLVCSFEDDPRVVGMWRSWGVVCFQVGR
jgi:prophage tail gpP-like protein